MGPALAATLFGLGAAGAFAAGLLGIGGALIMIPLLLYVPPVIGVGALDVKTVAAVTMVQVFVAALTGMLAHRRYQAVNVDLAWIGGVAMGTASFAGALLSKFAHERWLLLVFAVMATAAVILMLMPVDVRQDAFPAERVRFSRVRVAAVSGGVGLAAGFVGAGGAFLLVPLLLVVIGVPIRVTIGSSLAITAVAATAGVIGKLITGQVPPGPAVAVALGALPGASLGAAVSRRLRGLHLKLILVVLIALTALRVWWDVIVP
jgi:uncharacterized membrane protein YfcA